MEPVYVAATLSKFAESLYQAVEELKLKQEWEQDGEFVKLLRPVEVDA